MDSAHKVVVWVTGLLLVTITLIVGICMVADTVEKTTAFKQGLCQTTQVGYANWAWSTCPSKK